MSSDKSTEVVLAHLYSTELSDNEIAFPQVPTIINFSDFNQLKRLYACVESIRSWFEVFLAMHWISLFHIFTTCTLLGHPVQTLDAQQF